MAASCDRWERTLVSLLVRKSESNNDCEYRDYQDNASADEKKVVEIGLARWLLQSEKTAEEGKECGLKIDRLPDGVIVRFE